MEHRNLKEVRVQEELCHCSTVGMHYKSCQREEPSHGTEEAGTETAEEADTVAAGTRWGERR